MVEISPAVVHILGGEVALSEAVEAELEETFSSDSTTFEVVPGTTGTPTSVIARRALALSPMPALEAFTV